MRLVRTALLPALVLMAGCDKAPPAQPSGKPALWQVEDRAGKPLAWLFGTIHLLPEGSEWRTPLLEQSMAQADMLVVEVRNLDPEAIAPVLAALAPPCACPPLRDRVPVDSLSGLSEVMREAGVPPSSLDRTETWAAALTLASAIGAVESGPGADVALIETFRDRPIAELEGAGTQLAIFDALPEASQRRMLAEVVSEHGKNESGRLSSAWLAGDAATIAKETREGMMADAKIYEVLLRDRNDAWVGKLTPMIAAGKRPFVAVGAAHVVGPEGLAASLAAQGLTVRRIQ